MATAFAKLARLTPGLSPTKSDAPGTDCATYQFSVFDSPPSAAATDAGGWTCRLRPLGAVQPFDEQGKVRGRVPAGPHDLGRVALDQLAQARPVEGPSPHARLGLRPVDNLPAFPDRRPGRKLAPEERVEPAPAPHALLIKRLELKNFSHVGVYRDYCKKGTGEVYNWPPRLLASNPRFTAPRSTDAQIR